MIFPFNRMYNYFKNKINNKFKRYNDLQSMSDKYLTQEIQDIRHKIKRENNEKINIVFLCHRPSIWGSLKTVFEACLNDKQFFVTIVAISNKLQIGKTMFDHENYQTEGAEEYFRDFPCNVVNGYNYDKKEWFDLKSLKPDYLFFKTPYNVCRPLKYNSMLVSKYTKLCYVPYGILIFSDQVESEVTPWDYFRDVDIVFSETEFHRDRIKKRLENNNAYLPEFIISGYPRFDSFNNRHDFKSNIWRLKKEASFRCVWTPRWNTDEGVCTFFDYKDNFLNLCHNESNIDFVFRPHPQAFINYVESGDISSADLNTYIDKYGKAINMQIDYSGEYLSTFYTSDCLITDMSSIIPEYMLTGNPIIFCYKKNIFNDFGERLSKGFYIVKNWNELQEKLFMLRKGDDPLKQTRLEIIKNSFYLPPEGAGMKIKQAILDDFYKN